jgi:hypothetical protein
MTKNNGSDWFRFKGNVQLDWGAIDDIDAENNFTLFLHSILSSGRDSSHTSSMRCAINSTSASAIIRCAARNGILWHDRHDVLPNGFVHTYRITAFGKAWIAAMCNG